jgi:aryl-alcohol dehydrogenase-like predicted oxidoreductase
VIDLYYQRLVDPDTPIEETVAAGARYPDWAMATVNR